MEIIDQELEKQANKDAELDNLKASRTELNAHASASVLAHPDGGMSGLGYFQDTQSGDRQVTWKCAKAGKYQIQLFDDGSVSKPER